MAEKGGMGRACYAAGGCPTDYIAVVLTGVTCLWLLVTSAFVFYHRHFPPLRAKHVPLVTVGAASSVCWLIAMVVSQGLFKVPGGSFWDSCSLWKVWLGGLLGFGLWISCHVARGFRLYFVFVRKHYPPLSPFWVVTLLLLPWLAIALAFELGGALDNESGRCTAPLGWYVVLAAIHGVYVLLFLGATLSVRGIHFMFNEYRDQKRTAAVIVCFAGIWLILWTAKRIAGDSARQLQVAVRFTLIVAADVAALLFSWVPVQAPVRRLLRPGGGVNTPLAAAGDHTALTMGPILTAKALEAEGLETLLGFPRFLQAFKEFADSRLAGECVHFFEAVERRLDAGHVASPEARIYAADDVIAKYVRAGAPLQINISAAMRAKILRRNDLAAEDLFREARREALSIMQTNLEKDFYKSPQFAALKAALVQEAGESAQLRLMGISEVSTFAQLARLSPPSKRPPIHPPGATESEAPDIYQEEEKAQGIEVKDFEAVGTSFEEESSGGSSGRKRLSGPLAEHPNEAGLVGAAGSSRRSEEAGALTVQPLVSQNSGGSGDEPLLHRNQPPEPLRTSYEGFITHPDRVVKSGGDLDTAERSRRHTSPVESNGERLVRPRRYSDPVSASVSPRERSGASPSIVRLASRLAAETVASVTGARHGSAGLREEEERQMEDTLL
ncbi:hypothetical protein KFL_000430070 [Klebsormidium nitens]|uniref:RGS domain-containing protein n=1 Tax=Klebsormidium nitens TaxID=105231 RepID=A0A1Y1HMV6_KLENI|nr:hypothetical protein KFL_000430070 [Klebsormidium nitens]|eukprot:GAQ79965.1 hypothetical protein KFL_000430070 [Klebsormidium nitens]